MDKKIKSWRLRVPKDDKDAWTGEMTVSFNRDELNVLVDAIRDAYYEGCISERDMNSLFDKLNIDDD